MDREKVKKGVWQCWLPSTEEEYATQCHDCPYYEPGITLDECMTALRTDVLALLKEQEAWINEIAEYQQSISGSGMHELDDYEKGKWDGLQIAWNIISEGR